MTVEAPSVTVFFDGEKFCFKDWESIESILAGDALRNLKTAGACLHVSYTVRDTWIRVKGETEEDKNRGEKLIRDLIDLKQTHGIKPDQRQFQIVLDSLTPHHTSQIQSFFEERINVAPGKKPVVPRTANQLAYLQAIRKNDIVLGAGPAGTGKTYLAMAMAVSYLLNGGCDRIVLTRPAVEAGENLGFLPGNLEEKINPFLRPLYDALYDMMDITEADTLAEKNILEVAPLAFMRGRTLNHAFIILDEAQNTTKEQMLMFLTRMGQGSKCVVCGDPGQTDLPRRKDSGLLFALDRLSNIEGIRICRFQTCDVVRHALVEKIIHAFRDREPEQENVSDEQ